VGPTQIGNGFTPAAQGEDHPTAAHHVACGRCGDVEVGGDDLADRAREFGEVHVEQGDALQVLVGGGVERDIDAPGCGDLVGVRPHGAPVEGVHDRGLHVPASVPAPLRDLGQCVRGPAGEDNPGSFTRERTRDR